jgi:hypothetical protein
MCKVFEDNYLKKVAGLNTNLTDGDINKFKKREKELIKMGKSFTDILYEKNYVDMYQHFEEFMLNTFYILYKHFPKFIVNRTKDYKIYLDYADLFEVKDVTIGQDRCIYRLANNIVQRNNIFDIKKKYSNVFSININLTYKQLSEIYTISNNRNMIVHNNGKINNIYLSNLKKYNITSKYSENDIITKNIEDEREFSFYFLKKCVKIISNDLLSNIKQLMKNHESITL